MKSHDPHLHFHSLHVGIVTAAFTDFLGYSIRDRRDAIVAGLLHNVGKTRLSQSILRKSGPLTEAEWQLMRCHPDIGVILLKPEKDFGSDVLTAIQQHHERLDGTGYPQGLQAPSISEMVRVLSICDTYAAMTEDRAYEKRYSLQESLQALQARRRQFDPVLVRYFSRMALRESSRTTANLPESLDMIQKSISSVSR
jgi:HD-GYP domain-containing protein (c-di-GMP phosphodiesterase class II)